MTLNCEKCSKEFKYKSLLNQHLNRKTPCVKPTNVEQTTNVEPTTRSRPTRLQTTNESSTETRPTTRRSVRIPTNESTNTEPNTRRSARQSNNNNTNAQVRRVIANQTRNPMNKEEFERSIRESLRGINDSNNNNQRNNNQENTITRNYNIQLPPSSDINVIMKSLEEQMKDIELGGDEARKQLLDQLRNVLGNKEYLQQLYTQQQQQYYNNLFG